MDQCFPVARSSVSSLVTTTLACRWYQEACGKRFFRHNQAIQVDRKVSSTDASTRPYNELTNERDLPILKYDNITFSLCSISLAAFPLIAVLAETQALYLALIMADKKGWT